jgi:superfamily II DNA or RNA helicase
VRAFPQAVKDRILRFQRPVVVGYEPESRHIPTVQIDVSPTGQPKVPKDVSLRDYQLDAIQNWFDHEHRGLLVMATGSGKTITALSAVTRLIQEETRCFVLVSAPYQHLVDQWAAEAKRFGFSPVLAYQSSRRWSSALSDQIVSYNLGVSRVVTVITTHTTLCTDALQSLIAQVRGPAVFVADEAHQVGFKEI